MPIPKPKPSEKQSDFMQRCIPIARKEFNQQQAIAVCYNQWKNK